SEYLLEEGYNLDKDFVRLEKLSITNDPILKKHFKKECYCMERLYTLDGKPYIHFRHYIPGTVVIPEDKDHFQHSLYGIMYQQGFNFQSFEDQFSVGVPEESVAKQLGIEQKPLLKRDRFTYNEKGEVVEYSVAFYNTDMHKYVVTLDA